MNMSPVATIRVKGLDRTRAYLDDRIKEGYMLYEADIELQRLIQSHDLINKFNGPENCQDLLDSVENNESQYGSRFGVEYKKSSNRAEDLALMLNDDGEWSESSHYNYELDDSRFLNIARLRQALIDYASCQSVPQ